MTANTYNQTPLSATGNTDADMAKDIVFYDGMSEEELDLLLQASLTEDIDKANSKANPEPEPDQSAAAESSKPPVISTAVTNAQVPRPNKPTKYYSALSPSVADRTVFRSDSHKVETAKERSAMATAEVSKPAGSQLVIDDAVVEAPEEFKDLSLASAEAKASQAIPVPQQPAPTPRKSLKALTAAHSTSVKIRPKAAPTPTVAQSPTKVSASEQETRQTKPTEPPIAETPQVDSTPASTTATATDTAIPKADPKKVSAIKIKPKAAVSQPKTIAAESDSEVIVAQAPPVTPVAPVVVAEQSQTADQPNAVDQPQLEEQPQPAPVTSSTELPAANVETVSTVEPIVTDPVPSEPMQLESVQSDSVVTEPAPAAPAPLASDANIMDKTVIEETVIEQAIMTMPASESSVEHKMEQQTAQQVSPVANPDMDTHTLSEQVSADMHSFKTQLHQLTLQFHELSTLSARLVQQLRHLQSNSTEDFSVTYEQMLELRSHLVDTKKQASDLPSLLDVAEEALESDMYLAQTRKKR